MPAFRSPEGKIVYVTDEEASGYRAGGYVEVGEVAAGESQARIAPEEGGFLGSIGALASSALSGATLGISDQILKGALSRGDFERLAQDRRDNPILTGIGEFAGMLGPAVAAGGAIAPAGALSKAAAAGIEGAEAIGGAAGAARSLAIAGTEGAIQNAGIYLSEVALDDRELTAEGMAGALGTGFMFGGGGLIAAHGIQAGTIAARRMFARYAAGGEEAARAAEAAWRDHGAATLESFDQAAQLARTRLDEARLAREQADVARRQAAADVAEAKVAPLPPEVLPGVPASGAEPAAAGVAAAGPPTADDVLRLYREQARLDLAPDQREALDLQIADAMRQNIGQPWARVEYRGGPAAHTSPVDPDPAALQRLIDEGSPEYAELLPGAASAAPAQSPGFNTMIRDLESIPGVRRVTEQEADLAAKLDEYATARREFDDLHARVDPDLDAMLRNLGAPDIQGGRFSVPVGEFGKPGVRGVKSPTQLERAAAEAGLPDTPFAGGTPRGLGEVAAEQSPVTRVGKKKSGEAAAAEHRPRSQPGLPDRARNAGRYQIAEGTPPTPAAPTPAAPGQARRIEVGEVGTSKRYEARMPDGSTRPLRSSDDVETFLASQMPDGFSPGSSLITHQPFTIERGIPDTSADVAREVLDGMPFEANKIYITRPSELAERDLWGNEIKNANRDRVLKSWEEGKRLRPIEAYAMPDGRIYIEDGNHRLQAAARTDREVAIRFRDGDGYDPQRGARPIGDRLRQDFKRTEAPAPAAGPLVAAPDTDLEALLRGTKSQLDQGESFVAMGDPARAEYRAGKVERSAQSAKHFRGRAIEAHDVPAYDVIRAHENRADSAIAQTLPARKIAEHGYYEPPVRHDRPGISLEDADPIRLTNARKAIAEGQREPIALNVTPSGKITVTNGRHRLQAAIEADAPIKVKWSAGLEPAESDVYRGPIGAARDDLIAGSPAADIALRDATRAGAGERVRVALGPDQTSAFRIEDTGLRFDPTSRTYRDPTGRAMEATPVNEMNVGLAPRVEPVDVTTAREHPLAVKQLEMAHDDALERAAAATDPAVKQAAEAEARVIEKQLTQTGARPGVVEDVAALAPAVQRLERAAAELTEALGDVAPAAAKEHAKAFRAAEDAADAKSMARTARAADDHAAAQEAARAEDYLGPGTRQRNVDAAKKRRAEAEATYQRARATEAEAKIASRRADEALKRSTPRAGSGGSVSAGAHAVGYAAELGSELGIPGIPRPHDIPIVGPVLSAYLKYRALKAAAGRFVGRVPATADARAAELAARTRDNMARAVDRALGLVERSGPTIRRGITLAAIKVGDVLSKRLVDDGMPDAPAGASIQEKAAVRMREVAAAVASPHLILEKLSIETQGITDPDLIQALRAHLIAVFSHLNDTAPKGPPPNPYTKRQWVPSAADALQWGQRVAVANNPQVAFDMLEAGTLTPAPAETMRVVYKKLFAEAQKRLVARAADLQHPVEYRRLLQQALLFDVPLHASLDPENAIVLRSSFSVSSQGMPAPQQLGAPPVPGIAAPTNLTTIYQSGMDRSLGGR